MGPRVKVNKTPRLSGKPSASLRVLSERIQQLSTMGMPRVDFLQAISRTLLAAVRCDAVEFFLDGSGTPEHVEALRGRKHRINFNAGGWWRKRPSCLCRNGPVCIQDTRGEAAAKTLARLKFPRGASKFCGGSRSLILVAITTERASGILLLRSRKTGFFGETQSELCRGVARVIETALVNQRTQSALRERVKELTCLYGLAKIVESSKTPMGKALKRMSELLPPAWQYPEISSGRIILDGRVYSKGRFRDQGGSLSAPLIVNGKRRGTVDVGYAKSRPKLDEGSFLKEERSLINTLARQVALFIEQREGEVQSSRLQDQLRHADRLATIGQIAAGLAHELNEPLVNILGFAQLVQKDRELPPQARKDVKKIVDASLYARSVIKNLLLFARQMPSKKSLIDLNKTVEAALGFIEHQCQKAGIELVRSPSVAPPWITADSSQINQVVINLAVNAIHAMPNGGTITVRTKSEGDWAVLSIEDTGIGINKEVKKRIFSPFFTTKGPRQGTGLGLSVVQGIVTGHGGSIRVESRVGRGTRFEIRMPISVSKESDHESEKTSSGE